jgi:hypothetical protein
MKTAWLALALLVAACNSDELKPLSDSNGGPGTTATDLERVHPGIPAPDFTLESVDTAPVTLSGYRGSKNVVLVFFRGYW